MSVIGFAFAKGARLTRREKIDLRYRMLVGKGTDFYFVKSAH